MDVNQQDACHFCTSVVTFDLYLGQRPIVNNLAEDSGERDMFDLYMGQCRNCALVNVYHNLDPNIFYSDYSTPSHWKFEPHLENLVARITKNYSMESRILDIGCNDGRFLKYLANNGFQNLIGVEPGKNVANLAQKHNFVIYNNYFDSVFVQQLNKWEKKFDIVVSRQVLEHIKNIKEFLLNISLVIKPGGVLILEVPDSDLNWEHLDYGIWEEHFNYFNRQSLERILVESGWEVFEWHRSNFSGWCQTIFATKSVNDNIVLRPSGDSFLPYSKYSTLFQGLRRHVREKIRESKERGDVNLLGVGSRSLSTLWSLGLVDLIDNFYDENPKKQGRYVPNTGKKIKAASGLNRKEANLLLLGVNTESEKACVDRLQLSATFWRSILPPSEALLWQDYLDANFHGYREK